MPSLPGVDACFEADLSAFPALARHTLMPTGLPVASVTIVFGAVIASVSLAIAANSACLGLGADHRE